jgi:RimJ/RimL family protein N-acetyltransferase
MGPLVIPTERDDLLLRQCTESDLSPLLALTIRNREHFGWRGDPSPENVRRALVAPKGSLPLGLWHGNELIGHSYLSLLPAPYFGETGYVLDKERMGNGYATMSLRALVRHAFDRIELDGLAANVLGENPKSCKVLERVGFKLISNPQGVRNYRLEANEWFAMSRPT